jgi:hypothetical protein
MALAVGVTGCASSSKRPEQSALMVAALPTPNFEGPELIEPKAPAVAIKPPPLIVPPSRPITQGGVPREWVPQAQANAWQWIVIHHSATTTGGAAAFDKMHKAKGWDELGYHFVIGNGTDTRDGQVEVGSRWPRQKWGAHAKTPDNKYNDYGIGICLVGNFDNERPTKAQVQSLSHLVAYLMKTYKIPADRVIGHGDTKATDCPGKNVHIADIRKMAAQYAGMPYTEEGAAKTAAASELLTDLPK